MNKAVAKTISLPQRRAVSADPTLPAILEFQWPSTAVVNAPIPRSARGIVWLVASMFAAIVAALAVLPVDQVVTARGVVVAQAPTMLVQPLDTSIVRSIDVHEGEVVQAGQLLARLDPTFAAADLASLEAQVSTLTAQVARLAAEADGKPFDYKGTNPDWQLQASIYANHKAEYDFKLANYQHRLDELGALAARAESDASGYRERLGFAKDVEVMRKTLEEKDAGSRLNTLIAMDARAEIARSFANSEQTAKAANLERAALTAERDGYVRNWYGTVSQQLSDTASKASDAREQLNKAKLHRNLVELRADRDAIVQSLAKVSVGSVLQTGQPFITLVPSDTPLEVEANVSGGDAGFVHVRNSAVIKFDTFPYTQYGLAEGKLRVISPDSFAAPATAAAHDPTNAGSAPTTSSTEPFYRARISLDQVGLHDVPSGFRVVPGMPVTVDIMVGKRTVLQYFLGIIMPIAKEGMREP